MSWQHVICRKFLADMGDTQILWLNKSQEWHVASCRLLSMTLLGDVVCCMFLSHVVTQQRRMLTWRHIHHVGNMSQNVTCHWRCCSPFCYGDRWQFLLISYNNYRKILMYSQHLQANQFVERSKVEKTLNNDNIMQDTEKTLCSTNRFAPCADSSLNYSL